MKGRHTNNCVLEDSYILVHDADSHRLVFPDVSDDRIASISTHKNEGYTFLPMSGNTNPETRRHMPEDKSSQ